MNVVAIDLREHLLHIHATLAPGFGLDCDVAARDQRRVVEIGRQRLDQLGLADPSSEGGEKAVAFLQRRRAQL